MFKPIDYTPRKPAEPAKFAGKYGPVTVQRIVNGPVVVHAYRRETPHIPSLNADNMAPCTKPEAHRYTGTSMLGIAAMHKSNLVPIFNHEAARDAATMRRG